MGWDANSNVVYNKKSLTIKNKEQRAWFKEKSLGCILNHRAVDCGLERAWLDCSSCRDMLQRATGESCYTDWSSEGIQEMELNWSFRFKSENAWAYWSARYFLEGCKKFGLSVSFSY